MISETLSYSEGNDDSLELNQEKLDLIIGQLENADLPTCDQLVGQSLQDLSYPVLQVILPNGSENPEVASLLREKRAQHLKAHPEEKVADGAARGVIAYNGSFVPLSQWDKMSPGQKFAITVGPTCTHYNGDVPGFGRYD